MKKVIPFLFVLLSLGILTRPCYAVTVSFVPAFQDVYVDDTIALDLAISGLGTGGPLSLGAFSIDVQFDTNILVYDSVEFGQFLGDTDPLAFETDIFVDDSNVTGQPGILHLEEISFLTDLELDALQPFHFTLATLIFTTTNLGTTFVYPDNVILSDAFGFEISDPILGRAEIQVVPLPPTSILFISGFLLMFSLYQMKYQRHQNNVTAT